jgi:hypothetical protein
MAEREWNGVVVIKAKRNLGPQDRQLGVLSTPAATPKSTPKGMPERGKPRPVSLWRQCGMTYLLLNKNHSSFRNI